MWRNPEVARIHIFHVGNKTVTGMNKWPNDTNRILNFTSQMIPVRTRYVDVMHSGQQTVLFAAAAGNMAMVFWFFPV